MKQTTPWFLCLALLATCERPTTTRPEALRFQLFADSLPTGAPSIRLFHEQAVTRLPFYLDPKTLTVDRMAPSRFLVQRVRDGYLVGTNVGEFGGGVLWFSSDGKRQVPLVKDNCVGFVMDGDRALLLTGLSHLSTTRGALHRLARQEDGRWRLERSLQLTGAPREVRWTLSGDLELVLHQSVFFRHETSLDDGPWEASGERLLFRGGILRTPF